MMRLASLFPLAILAGCSQPASVVDLKSSTALPNSAARAGTQGDPSALARCQNANWRATGYRHGLSGFPLTALKQVTDACDGTGVEIDRLAYSTGRLEGLTLFCSTESGYRRAKAGQPLANPCPPTLAKAYEEGYARGMAE